jgi:hypothetical protein
MLVSSSDGAQVDAAIDAVPADPARGVRRRRGPHLPTIALRIPSGSADRRAGGADARTAPRPRRPPGRAAGPRRSAGREARALGHPLTLSAALASSARAIDSGDDEAAVAVSTS